MMAINIASTHALQDGQAELILAIRD